jgi:hypothetical protein
MKATDAALATSAAPTFFIAAKTENMVAPGSYFDGGVVMIVILYQDKYTSMAEAIGKDLLAAFSDQLKVELLSADADSSWPAKPDWDDLLVVIYDKEDFPEPGSRFITQYQQRPQHAMLLPVAADPTVRKPPKAASGIKALPYDDAAKGKGGRLITRVGAMLGLRVQGRDSKIFLSYRASDGKAIAEQLYEYLKELGHDPFLDEAPEGDGYTKILPGNPVQSEIDERLKTSKLLLLIDTPDAPNSDWIKYEIDTADASLVPILPITFRDVTDPKQGPRFRSLLELQRWVQLPKSPSDAKPPLSSEQLQEIQHQMEDYMCEIFKRKLRVPFIVEKEFSTRGFDWSVVSGPLLIYRSSKPPSGRVITKVFSHCSLFDPFYTPAMKTFAGFLKQATSQSNYNLFIYDGELLPESQLKEVIEAQGGSNVIILHHQELAVLIDSGFTKVGVS